MRTENDINGSQTPSMTKCAKTNHGAQQSEACSAQLYSHGSHTSWKVLKSTGFFGQISWKVLENDFCSRESWKFHLEVPGKYWKCFPSKVAYSISVNLDCLALN